MSNLLNKLSGGSTGTTGNTTNNNAGLGGQQNTTANGASGQEDYLDKGLDFAEKKFGGGKNLGRDTNEKITDSARAGFEKVTGKNVPDKFSN